MISNKNSRRFKRNKISVVRRKCPFCKHHKAIVSTTVIKCARCKKIIDG